MAQVIEPTAGTDLGGLFEVVVKVRSEDTNGVLAAIEQTVPPRKLIPPHTHENDVWVYVLTGEIGILVGDEVEHAGAGSWALKPRNVVPGLGVAAAFRYPMEHGLAVASKQHASRADPRQALTA